MKRKTKKIISISVISLIVLILVGAKSKRVSPLTWGMHPEINQPNFSNEALNGYDVVAYFTDQKAIVGKEQHVFSWKEADWYFSSEKNKQLFAENPENYLPQFGGYCAFAVSKGFTANSDPEAFQFIDGKLYLFADQGVMKDWMENPAESLSLCNSNWK